MITVKIYEVITVDGQVAVSRMYTENSIPRSKSWTCAKIHAEIQVSTSTSNSVSASSRFRNGQSTSYLQILCCILFSVRSTVLLSKTRAILHLVEAMTTEICEIVYRTESIRPLRVAESAHRNAIRIILIHISSIIRGQIVQSCPENDLFSLLRKEMQCSRPHS